MLPSDSIQYRPALGLSATGFERFLHTMVGEDDNGLPLSVLSVLARHDVDPWEEAASIARLPEAEALDRLNRLLGRAAEPAVVHKLIALLPGQSRGPCSLSDRVIRVFSNWHVGLLSLIVVALLICTTIALVID